MKYIIYLYIFVLIISISSCQRSGCTDKNAVNYESGAKKDDGTCEYKGSVVFWYGKNTAQKLTNIGVTALKYYIGSELVGSGAASVYWNSSPDCGQNQSITVEKDLGIAKNKSFMYSVKDENGNTLWSNVINFTANTCLKMELVY